MKKFATDRYWELIDKFREKPSGEIPYAIFPDYLGAITTEYVYVSYRHYTCLAYLVFFQERSPESVVFLRDAVVQWRKKAKEYRPERTLIEVIARRSYTRYKKWLKNVVLANQARGNWGKKNGKASKENKTGIFHPSVTSEMHAAAKKKWHEVVRKTGGYNSAFWWKITFPDGTEVVTNDVPSVCEKEGIVVKSLRNHGKVRGYTMERAEPPHPEWMTLPHRERSGFDPNQKRGGGR
jgi:hypothetical protein